VANTKATTRNRAALSPAEPAAEPAKSVLPPYTVETWSVDRLKPYDRNARKYGAIQIEQLRGSFRKFGQVWPLLVREDGTVIAGHGRLEAAKLEGFTQVRVIVATGWSADQCQAFGLADNKIALNGEWNEELLGLELADLSSPGVPLGELGFAEAELGELLAPPAEPSAEAKPNELSPVIQFNIVFDDERQQENKRLSADHYPADRVIRPR
jgi:ParB-like chromosome segregation protein Spo0J